MLFKLAGLAGRGVYTSALRKLGGQPCQEATSAHSSQQLHQLPWLRHAPCAKPSEPLCSEQASRVEPQPAVSATQESCLRICEEGHTHFSAPKMASSASRSRRSPCKAKNRGP